MEFKGDIIVKNKNESQKEEAIQEAIEAFQHVSTIDNPWLVICTDASWHKNRRGGVAAVCNRNWLPQDIITDKNNLDSAASSAATGEALVEEAIAFSYVTSSLLSEAIGTSLGLHLALSELERNKTRLKKGCTVRIVLICDCTGVWDNLLKKGTTCNTPGRTQQTNQALLAVRRLSFLQSHIIHGLAARLGIATVTVGRWAPRTTYARVRYLGRADYLAGMARRTGLSRSSVVGNDFERPCASTYWLYSTESHLRNCAIIITSSDQIVACVETKSAKKRAGKQTRRLGKAQKKASRARRETRVKRTRNNTRQHRKAEEQPDATTAKSGEPERSLASHQLHEARKRPHEAPEKEGKNGDHAAKRAKTETRRETISNLWNSFKASFANVFRSEKHWL